MRRSFQRHVLTQPQALELRFPREFREDVAAEFCRLCDFPLQKYPFSPKWTDLNDVVDQVDSPFPGRSGTRVEQVHFRMFTEIALRMRCLRDMLWELGEFRVGGYRELKDAFSRVSWADILPPGAALKLQVRSLGSRLFHESGIREALSECFVGAGYRILSTQEKFQTEQSASGTFSLEAVLERNHLRFLLSCFGESGGHRGFKKSFLAQAPLKSELAACLFHMLKAWSSRAEPTNQLLVPFVGSGTFVVEALLSLGDIPGGYFRKSYDCERFLCAAVASNEFLRRKCLLSVDTQALPEKILAIDIDGQQCEAAEENLENALSTLSQHVHYSPAWKVSCVDYLDVLEHEESLRNHKISDSVCLPLNPPYGQRLPGAGVGSYARLGEWVRNLPQQGKYGFVIAPNEVYTQAFLKALQPNRSLLTKFRNGGLLVEALFFESH